MTYRKDALGRDISLLGYGAMRIPTVSRGGTPKAHLDQATLNEHVDWLIEHGVNYFDTSPCYCQGESESALGEALSRHPREKYYLATKLSNFAPEQFPFEKCVAMFEDSLKYLRTDHIDFYLLHSVGGGGGMANFKKRYLDNHILPWLFEQKRLGRIRQLGWSFHGDIKVFEWLLEQHDKGVYHWDFAMIQLNFIEWHNSKKSDSRSTDAAYLYRELDRRGIRVNVMEPLLGGALARHNDAIANELVPLDGEATQAKWAMRFCGGLPRVLTVLSGMSRKEHMEENVATYSPLKPLDDREFAAIERAASAYLKCANIACTRCNYCMPCPYGLDIPTLIMFMNEVHDKRLSDRLAIRQLYERAVPDPRRRADRCIGCGKCTPHCPQNINIPKVMDSIAAFVEAHA